MNITWVNSQSFEADYEANDALWNKIADILHSIAKSTEDGCFYCFTGVFHPGAMEAVNHCIPMLSPISSQNAVERSDGTKTIEFQHLRWSGNLNMKI